MTVVIRAENLGKKFIISHERPERYTALRDVIVSKTKRIIHKTRSLFNDNYLPDGEAEEFWALKNINLEIRQGDRLGIIGRNGAGKSTLLKILSRITESTTGWVGIKGRVASLLEVGTGFHPELTGKENIYLNGAILGMTRAEIKRKFDEIVDFSGVEKFLDTPVKRYSSGMRVRLAFSVAAHLEPEILIIDEVLAVGDADFQKKCLGKMKDVAGEGRTVIFVSHNMVAVQSLCNRGILLHNGELIHSGSSNEVVHHYIGNIFKHSNINYWEDKDKAPGNNLLKLLKVSVLPENDKTSGVITIEESFEIKIQIHNLCIEDSDFNIALHVLNEEDIIAFAGSLADSGLNLNFERGMNYSFSCKIPGKLLNSGFYRINLLFFRTAKLLFRVDEVVGFSIIESQRKGNWYGKRAGVFRPELDWSVSLTGSEKEVKSYEF